MYVRLIKPGWGKPFVRKKPNPDFKKEISGYDVIEGDYSEESLKDLNQKGYNVYFFPNGASNKPEGSNFLSSDDIDKFQYVFVDMDLKDGIYKSKTDFLTKLSEFSLEPSLCVDSGNGVHVYWWVEDLTKTSYMELQLALIDYFKTDQSVWTPLQLMRAPGFFNTKKFDEFKPAEIIFSKKNKYGLDQIKKALPENTPAHIKKINDHLNKANAISELTSMQFVDYDELPEKFVKILESPEASEKHLRDLFYEPEKTKGDRSTADMRLAHILYAHKGFDKKELMQVILNSKKASSRSGSGRLNYAASIVQKMVESIVDKKYDGLSVAELRKTDKVRELGQPINGPFFIDTGVLEKPWRKKQVLGMIGAPGIGKTTLTLEIFRHAIKNNPDNDDVYVFFSLEMTAEEIIERWRKVTGEDNSLDSRLYVIANETPEGEPRHINLQDIVGFTNAIKKKTGCNVGAIAIDHVGVVNPEIDLDVDPNFGVEFLTEGRTRKRAISIQVMCSKVKELAKYLDTFVILQSQTTKDKAKGGDVPLETNAAYGTANFEWYCDYILTIWQPLYRVQHLCPLTALAWKYAKIREKGSGDLIKPGQHNALIYDLSSGRLNLPTEQELTIINHWQNEAQKVRNMQNEDKGMPEFRLSELKRLLERNQ